MKSLFRFLRHDTSHQIILIFPVTATMKPHPQNNLEKMHKDNVVTVSGQSKMPLLFGSTMILSKIKILPEIPRVGEKVVNRDEQHYRNWSHTVIGVIHHPTYPHPLIVLKPFMFECRYGCTNEQWLKEYAEHPKKRIRDDNFPDWQQLKNFMGYQEMTLDKTIDSLLGNSHHFDCLL